MHKNLLFTFLLACISSTIFSQSFTITPTDSVSVIETVTTNNDEVVLYAYVKNITATDLTFKWRVTSSDYPSTWDVSYCDNTDCLDLGSFDQNTFLLKADSTSILKMAYLPYLTGGVSEIEMSVSVDGDPSSAVSVKYYAGITASPVGIKAIDTKTISLFPNPAINFIQIKGIENPSDVNSIEVYSIIGKKIMSQNVSTISDLKVNTQNLDYGVYLVKLFDNKKNLFYTKTFVKK